ncbi:hypothetical protein [Nitrospirillum viridazoti]|uniref:Uncharacterized protein n=1 Tax=Nitrospirillum viridazoti CBAmc TaxID=1441467 RepID=A0A248JS79_9PROT|nr:hypothetical protein [Nitrospirillum amazonense]ASG21396.1 hypothetical protein Y958_11580 [Nitrospirillum amazonense CBAmc]TWB33074.1 hypothetical protein FBZ91_115136 [Nitrospirillum amazonense]
MADDHEVSGTRALLTLAEWMGLAASVRTFPVDPGSVPVFAPAPEAFERFGGEMNWKGCLKRSNASARHGEVRDV